MLRYVLAVLLTVAVLGVAVVAVDHGTAVRGERQAVAAVAALDTAAVDLYENEALALAGGHPPRRAVEVTLPGAGYTSAPAEHISFERVPEQPHTRVTYRISGRAKRGHVVDAPLVRAGESQFRLDGVTGPVTLVLRLVPDDDGRPVVSVTVDR